MGYWGLTAIALLAIPAAHGAEPHAHAISPLAEAARRVMAAMYGDCAILNLPIESLAREKGARGAHTSSVNCEKVRSRTVQYVLGAKPDVAAFAHREIIFAQNVDQTQAQIDCTGFLDAALADAGWRATEAHGAPGSKTTKIHQSALLEINSDGYASLDRQAGTCFDLVELGAQATIQSGDIFAFGSEGKEPGHVFIVESAGPDPFGLDPLNGNCDGVDPAHFDFDIIQSSAVARDDGPPLGPNRIRASVYFQLSGNRDGAAKMRAFAKQACLARTSGVAARAASDDATGRKRASAILRHRATLACRSKPFAIPDEACLPKSCLRP